MNTRELVTTFLDKCKSKGLSNNTITGYTSYLTRFALDNPELPEEPSIIENWLKTKGESFENRGNTLRRLQLFYEDLAITKVIPNNPIPAGHPGRPKGAKIQHITQKGTPPQQNDIQQQPPTPQAKPPDNLPHPDTATLVEEYLTSCAARGLSKLTIRAYTDQLNKLAKLYPTLTYNLSDIEKAWAGLEEKQDEYKYQRFRIIRAFYYWLADIKELPTHLKFRRITPKRTPKHPDNLSDEKAAEFLALLPTMPPQDRAIIELLIEAGPRSAELRSIVKEHIYDENILVKGKEGERIIEISPHVRDTLRNLTPETTGPIFWTPTHLPLDESTLYQTIKKYLAQIGITSGKRGAHMLRHSMGRLYMASEKGDIESLRQQMGHTNITTTAIYTQLNRKQVHKKFNAANPRERIMEIIHTNRKDEQQPLPFKQQQ